MKVVLDTNVLISGIYFGGLPGKILEAWGARQFQLLVSTEIHQEYLNVVETPKAFVSESLDLSD
jgi:putative PIN family toxin of toxin-antitoxin system